MVKAAWTVILEEGLDAATMRRIASRANCTTGLVTHYFTNKEEVLLTLVRHVARRTGERMAAAMLGRTGLDAVRAILMESAPITREHSEEWRIWVALWENALSNPRLHTEWTKSSDGWREAVRSGLEQAIADGNLASDTPLDQVVDTLTAFHYGLSLSAVLAPSRPLASRMVDALDSQLLYVATTYPGPATRQVRSDFRTTAPRTE